MQNKGYFKMPNDVWSDAEAHSGSGEAMQANCGSTHTAAHTSLLLLDRITRKLLYFLTLESAVVRVMSPK